MAAPREHGLRGWRRASLVAIKTVHTIAFFSIGSCLAYFAYSSLTRRSDRRAATAGAAVTGEAVVYALNGFRCPLTTLAERLGSEHGSVADIYLPRWIEDHLPYITGPIFAGALLLHGRNILRSRQERTIRSRTKAVPAPRTVTLGPLVDMAFGPRASPASSARHRSTSDERLKREWGRRNSVPRDVERR